MLDKNPDQDFTLRVNPILEEFNLNSVLCSEPFVKASFLEKIIQNSDVDLVYLDFDLLYSGFISGGFVSKKENVHLIRPDVDSLEDTLKVILEKISKEKSIVIIDSLNGFYNIFDEKDAGRLINSYILLLSFVAKTTGSKIILVSMARINDKKSWVLMPSGRQIVTTQQMTVLQLKSQDAHILINLLDEENSTKESIKILNYKN